VLGQRLARSERTISGGDDGACATARDEDNAAASAELGQRLLHEIEQREAVGVHGLRELLEIGAEQRRWIDQGRAVHDVQCAGVRLGGCRDDLLAACDRPDIGLDRRYLRASLLDARLASISKAVDNVALALANFRHVNADGSGVNAVVSASTRQVCNAPAGHHGLGWSAALVHAGAANVFSFDESRAHSSFSEGGRERSTRLPGTYDD